MLDIFNIVFPHLRLDSHWLWANLQWPHSQGSWCCLVEIRLYGAFAADHVPLIGYGQPV